MDFVNSEMLCKRVIIEFIAHEPLYASHKGLVISMEYGLELLSCLKSLDVLGATWNCIGSW